MLPDSPTIADETIIPTLVSMPIYTYDLQKVYPIHMKFGVQLEVDK